MSTINNVDYEYGRRYYLLTSPRTASNLLMRILAIDDQPNFRARRTGGYFFLHSFIRGVEKQLCGKNLDLWTVEEKEQMLQSYQASFDELEKHLEEAQEEGKMTFVKEHVGHLIEPTAQTDFLYGPRNGREPPWKVQDHFDKRGDGHLSKQDPIGFEHLGHVPNTLGIDSRRTDGNQTFLPDKFLETFRATFLIRHPALAFPSYYRAFKDVLNQKSDEDVGLDEAQIALSMNLQFTRSLFDWNMRLRGTALGEDDESRWPLVLDADDVMTEPELIFRFCHIVGLDSSKLKFSWAPAGEEEMTQIPDQFARRFLDTLWSSKGIMKGKTSIGLEIDVEAKKWREEFGEVEGEKMEEWVRAAMPDYEFMKARRLRPKSPQVTSGSLR